MGKIDNERLTQAIDDISAVRETFKLGNGTTCKSIYESLSIVLEILENYHLAFWQYGKVEDYYSCERCGYVIDWHGMLIKDLPGRCSACGNYMHKDARPSPEAYPELYKPQGFTFNVDKIEKFEDASCENCEHAFRGADPLKIVQDSKYLFYCAAGHAYGGSETVCSEWRRKEGEQDDDQTVL